MQTQPKSKVLIVDDQPANINILSYFLVEYGFEIFVATTGEKALDRVTKILPDIILLDVMMPGIDGFETCRRLKSIDEVKDIPVIFMTALSEAADKVKGLTLGAVDYITKPLEHSEAIARINVHLQLRNLTKQLEQQNMLLRAEVRSRQLAELALRFSEEKFAKAFRSSPAAMTIATLEEGYLTEVNQSFCNLTGYFPEEILGKTDRQINLWDNLGDRDRFLQILQASGAIYKQEFLFRTKFDKIKCVLISAEIISIGDTNCILMMTYDITEQKLAQETSYRREQEFRALAENSPDMIARFDKQLRHLYVNPAAELATGIPAAAFTGKTHRELGMSEEVVMLSEANLRAVFANGTEQCFEFNFLTKSGTKFYQVCMVPEFKRDRTIASVLSVSRDITAVKQAELELRKSELREREKAIQLKLTLDNLRRTQSQLIQTEKMLSLGRMVAGVAHEINNPNSFILGNINPARHYFQDLNNLLELYKNKYPEPGAEIQQLAESIDLDFLQKDWSRLMQSIESGASRIQQIVDSLKFFTKLDESGIKEIDINQNIDHTLLFVQHRAGGKGISKKSGNSIISQEIEVIKNYGNLPEVPCYSSQLNQVFASLLNNAIDALETQPYPKIVIHTELETAECSGVGKGNATRPYNQLSATIPPKNSSSQFAVIRIADNGIGMSEEVLKKMFDPFFTTKPVGSGTGLGLSISHQIVVEQHGGQISCISAPGKGTEFVVKIPLQQVTCDRETRHAVSL
jgi:two-component system, NtrC family, sensor kinase